ncbi:MAG: hypothetical protein JXJ04_20315 [Spirochaetales bacterium]|nr:hypothetical protein [Spirochaetales bacterium]
MKIPDNLFEMVKTVVNSLAGLILFFMTPTGIIVFGTIIFLYFVVTITHLWRSHTLALTAAGKETKGVRNTFEKAGLLFIELLKLVGRVVSNLPVLLCVLVIFLLIVGTSQLFNEFDAFMANENRIKEMRTVLKHLDRRYKVADVRVINQDSHGTTMNISFYDYADLGTTYATQEVTIKGNDIYVDAIILNFDYSEISEGKAINIAIPYRIFSNEVSQAEGILLDMTDENGIPLLFKRSEEDLYGIDETSYTTRLKEILSFMENKKAARAAGVRSVYGNAVHKRVSQGDFFSIWIEQTGGLVIKQGEEF